MARPKTRSSPSPKCRRCNASASPRTSLRSCPSSPVRMRAGSTDRYCAPMAVSLKNAKTLAYLNDWRIIMKSVILVTGAGTGIGKLSAQALAEAGHVVYATMRDVEGRNRGRADELRALSAEKGIALIPLELDVLSQDSADAAAATIVREQGRID